VIPRLWHSPLDNQPRVPFSWFLSWSYIESTHPARCLGTHLSGDPPPLTGSIGQCGPPCDPRTDLRRASGNHRLSLPPNNGLSHPGICFAVPPSDFSNYVTNQEDLLAIVRRKTSFRIGKIGLILHRSII